MKTLKECAQYVFENNTYEVSQTCLIEECAELIQSCCKINRKRDTNFVTELAHVMLMCQVAILNNNVNEEAILMHVNNAVMRMKQKQCPYYRKETGCIYCTRKCEIKP